MGGGELPALPLEPPKGRQGGDKRTVVLSVGTGNFPKAFHSQLPAWGQTTLQTCAPEMGTAKVQARGAGTEPSRTDASLNRRVSVLEAKAKGEEL